jgi:hypothetical protein
MSSITYLDRQKYKFAVIIDAILEHEEKGQLCDQTIYKLKQLQKLKDYKWQNRGLPKPHEPVEEEEKEVH